MPERLLIIFFIAIRTLNFGSAQEKYPRALGKIFSLPRPQKNHPLFDIAKIRTFSPHSKLLYQNF